MKDLAKPILVVGSLNMDLVIRVANLPLKGETIFGKTFTTFPGGKGGNQAVAASKLGAKVTMVGAVGRDDFGDKLLCSLSEGNVDTSYISITENSTGTALITVDDNGANSIVVVPGANNACFPSDIDTVLDLVEGPGILLVQNEIPEETVGYAIKRAKEQGWITILNPAPARQIDNELLSMIDIIIPNETEAAVLTESEAGSEEQAAQELLARGVAAVIVTLGNKGALYCTAKETCYIPTYKVKAVDTTAAGDAYVGALATALSQGKTVLESAKFATAVAALSVTRPGAQPALPWREEVDEFISKQEEK
ncbi:ribokinase [Pelosinus sp. UFO1]|uniref:ribokinase n=1 Tax=Pelosinus sp. UFO1 TaxID=484770 RepID=UPI0004D1B533|nr:ribokinase [Pelosinus sp. UFO1]AIF50816.1 ribokinase [Pelosinus sp. UFO1]